MFIAKYYAAKSLNPETNLMLLDTKINKAGDNTERSPRNVSNPVVHIGAAIKGWLDELNHSSKGTRPHKYWE